MNPLAGCLPTLATIPIFIGLYKALTKAADEVRHTAGSAMRGGNKALDEGRECDEGRRGEGRHSRFRGDSIFDEVRCG